MTQELLDAIRPTNGTKFSPNLFRWAYKHQHRDLRVYMRSGKREGLPDMLYIGDFYDGDFIGMHLIRVLCQGIALQELCYLSGTFTEVPDFWERYVKIGRCAIDTNHQMRWMPFDCNVQRYEIEGDKRVCQWCGAVQIRRKRSEVKTVNWEEWEAVHANSNRELHEMSRGEW
jgi:hypothetical protein